MGNYILSGVVCQEINSWLELQYRSQADSRQLSGGPKEKVPLFEDLKGVISHQALLFGPTEKAAKGNQPSIDGGRFQAFLN
jgi:hypothetical protein